MGRGLALPLIMLFGMGLDLPATGPVPAENPRQPQSVAEDPPVPVPKPSPVSPGSRDEGERAPVAPRPDTAEPSNGAPSSQEKSPEKTEKTALPDIQAPKVDEAALVRCEAELRKLGAVFDRLDPVRGDNGCGIQAPYRIDQVVRGVALSLGSELRCETALALARWTAAVVIPAAKALPDAVTLTGINHGSTYVCRRRNNLDTGKMSEHAIGNAIDIANFEFDGRQPIGISPRQGDGDMEEAFQRAVRGGACLHFTTVLGPGSDASHAGHLHLDIAERRGGYRLCQ